MKPAELERLNKLIGSIHQQYTTIKSLESLTIDFSVDAPGSQAYDYMMAFMQLPMQERLVIKARAIELAKEKIIAMQEEFDKA